MFDDPTMTNLDEKMIEAQLQLQSLEDVDQDTKIERLREAVPNHPFFLMRNVGFGAAISFFVILVMTFAAPIVDPKTAMTMAAMDAIVGVPLPLALILVVSALVMMGIAGHMATVWRAETAPLLPEERKMQQHLVQTLVRIEAKKKVESRKPKKAKNSLIS
jgi:hypothetical protein